MATAKKLTSGSWRCLIYDSTDENGKRKYKSFTAPTKKEAEYLATQYLIEKDQKKQHKSEALFSDELSKYISIKESVLSPSTIRGYKNMEGILKRDYKEFYSISRSAPLLCIYSSRSWDSRRIHYGRRWMVF